MIICRCLQAAFDKIIGVKVAPNGARIVMAALECEHRVAGNHREVWVTGKVDDKVGRQPICKA